MSWPGTLRDRWLAILLWIGALGSALLAWQSFTHTQVEVQWSTASEVNTAGFNLYRSETGSSDQKKINSSLIPTRGDALAGAEYRYTDSSVQPWGTYDYWLEEIETGGSSNRHGPITVQAQGGGWVEALAAAALTALAVLATRSQLRRPQPAGKSDGTG